MSAEVMGSGVCASRSVRKTAMSSRGCSAAWAEQRGQGRGAVVGRRLEAEVAGLRGSRLTSRRWLRARDPPHPPRAQAARGGAGALRQLRQRYFDGNKRCAARRQHPGSSGGLTSAPQQSQRLGKHWGLALLSSSFFFTHSTPSSTSLRRNGNFSFGLAFRFVAKIPSIKMMDPGILPSTIAAVA
jgi:hypothetical protein